MQVREKVAQIKSSIGDVLVGKEKQTDLVMVALLSNGHVLMEDVPGTGKTMLAKSMAKSIDGQFNRIQFTPDVMPSDVTGIQYLNPKSQEFEMKYGPVMTNVLLADEINRATPRTQSSLLEVMEEKQVTIDGVTVKLPSPFIVIATQNPIESQGTFPLPEAQMDRFLMKIPAGYPTMEEEKVIMRKYRNDEPIEHLKPVFSADDIEKMQALIKEVMISDEIEDYMLEIIAATRSSRLVDVGVSPRGTLAFMRAVRSYAFIKGRDFVTPQDVKDIAPYVLSHRLVLSMEGGMKKTQEEVINEILKVVEVPVEAGANS